MKYYAVTEDPRELYHYGVKGMKWGQHIFGPEPGLKKSDAYKRSLQKLRSLSSKGAKATGKALKTSAKKVSSGAKTVGSAIQKSAAQISYNRRVAQQNKFNKAVEKAQKRNQLSSTLRELDNEEKYRKQLARDQKIESLREKQSDIMAKNDLKSLRRAVKVEKHMPKYFQEARTGTLKYGKLSDEQIGRLQDRLALEASTRRLGNTEPMSWRQQKKTARRRGYLEGISKGTSAAMEEVARAGAQYGIQHIMNRKKLDKASEYKAQREKEASRIKNKKTHAEAREDFKQEVYEAQIHAGMHAKRAAKNLQEAKRIQNENQVKLDAEKAKLEIKNKIENENEEQWQRYLSDNNMTDKGAREAYREQLRQDWLMTQQKYGKGHVLTEQAKERLSIYDKGHGEAKAKSQRAIMTAADKKAAFDAVNKYNRDKEAYDIAKAAYDKKMNDYWKALATWRNAGRTGKRPTKPRLTVTMPQLSDYQLNQLARSMGLLGNGNNGGGKKK